MKGEALGASLHPLPIRHPFLLSKALPGPAAAQTTKAKQPFIYQCGAPSERPLAAEGRTPNHCLHDLVTTFFKHYVPKKAVEQVNAFLLELRRFCIQEWHFVCNSTEPIYTGCFVINPLLSRLSPQQCGTPLQAETAPLYLHRPGF